MRQVSSDRAEARRARRLSEDVLSDARARTALTDYADELDRRADELERAARNLAQDLRDKSADGGNG